MYRVQSSTIIPKIMSFLNKSDGLQFGGGEHVIYCGGLTIDLKKTAIVEKTDNM